MAAGAAVVVGAGMATGAEPSTAYTKPLAAAEQQAALHYKMPNARFLRHVHPPRKHHHHHHHRKAEQTASRSTYRSPISGSPQTIAHAMLLRRGWSESEWTCLDALWTRESGWSVTATNASSGAYGIPQALPATKMASYGSDYRTNPVTQITWGLDYIASAYGTPCAALSHSNATGYY